MTALQADQLISAIHQIDITLMFMIWPALIVLVIATIAKKRS